jgi:hypothetical protein
LSLTEQDEDLALRGFLVASMNILPNDPLLLECSREELLFAAHWKRKNIADMWDNIASMIGTRWRPENVHATAPTGKDKKVVHDHYDFPLSVLLNLDLPNALKKMVPRPRGARVEEADLGDTMGFDVIREHQRRLANEAKALVSGV